jgi:UDP-MurNAc hydroxylase
MSDEIVWINHAGYELHTNGLRIVHDPWLDGMAFADGWALVAASRHTAADLAGADYIWFSHEHPDHFSPAVLRAIPEEARAKIKILFQKTRDQRVVNFCRKFGFDVQELPNRERVALGNDVFVTCGTAGHDSWLFVETPERTYFNANDVVDTDWPSVAAILSRPVDVLLTQFSYAAWVGNPDDDARMAREAALKFADMDRQIDAFRPRALIPFASYVWFCREENFHLNSRANRIDATYARYKDRLETVVLYPGDRYVPAEPWNSEASIARYVADWEAHRAPLDLADATVPFDQIEQMSHEQQERLAKANMLWLLRPLQLVKFLPPVSIYLKDLELGLRYSMFGGILATGLPRAECEIEMRSVSFANMLKNGYGYGTLSINGRFLELSDGAILRLSRHFAIPAQNEQGYGVPGIFLRGEYVRAKVRRLVKAVFGRLVPRPSRSPQP